MADIKIIEIDGLCPVQAEGTIDGKPFYFRARGQHWHIGIGDDPMGNPEWGYGGTYGEPYEAGYLDRPEATATAFIELAAYIRQLEDAILSGEQFAADIETSRRKGYTPRPLFDAADAIRARRRGDHT
ncbi:hypothetical protein [Microcystis phage Mae-JY30]